MKVSKSVGACVLLLTVAGGAGCVVGATTDPGATEGESALAARELPTVLSVTANGTGCPTGRWKATVNPGGKSVTVALDTPPVVDAGPPLLDAGPRPDDDASAAIDAGAVHDDAAREALVGDDAPRDDDAIMKAAVTRGQSSAIADCTFSIDLRARGQSFAVQSVAFDAVAKLDQPGMKAAQTAKFYFQGNPVPARELRAEVSGPFDDALTLAQTVASRDRVWSPCTATRRLNAQTRVVLTNNSRKTGQGSVSVAPSFTFGLAWRTCG